MRVPSWPSVDSSSGSSSVRESIRMKSITYKKLRRIRNLSIKYKALKDCLQNTKKNNPENVYVMENECAAFFLINTCSYTSFKDKVTRLISLRN